MANPIWKRVSDHWWESEERGEDGEPAFLLVKISNGTHLPWRLTSPHSEGFEWFDSVDAAKFCVRIRVKDREGKNGT